MPLRRFDCRLSCNATAYQVIQWFRLEETVQSAGMSLSATNVWVAPPATGESRGDPGCLPRVYWSSWAEPANESSADCAASQRTNGDHAGNGGAP